MAGKKKSSKNALLTPAKAEAKENPTSEELSVNGKDGHGFAVSYSSRNPDEYLTIQTLSIRSGEDLYFDSLPVSAEFLDNLKGVRVRAVRKVDFTPKVIKRKPAAEVKPKAMLCWDGPTDIHHDPQGKWLKGKWQEVSREVAKLYHGKKNWKVRA